MVFTISDVLLLSLMMLADVDVHKETF